MTCLARNPGRYPLITWCGLTQGREGKKYLAELAKARELHGERIGALYGPSCIATYGTWDCPRCTAGMEAEARRIHELLERIPADAKPTYDLGCGDSGCCLKRPGGVGTNGGCSCGGRGGWDAILLKSGAQAWRHYALALEARIKPSEV